MLSPDVLIADGEEGVGPVSRQGRVSGGKGGPYDFDRGSVRDLHLYPVSANRFTVASEQPNGHLHRHPRGFTHRRWVGDDGLQRVSTTALALGHYVWKEWPQPQVPFAFGFLIEKPDP